MKNVQFCPRSRKTKILTTGIHLVFRGLKFESDAEIGQKGAFFKGLQERKRLDLGGDRNGKQGKKSVLGCQEVFSEAIGGRVLFFPDLSSGEIPPQAGLHRSLLAGEKAEGRTASPADKSRPLKNVQFCPRSRRTKILTTGIHLVFRGLKF